MITRSLGYLWPRQVVSWYGVALSMVPMSDTVCNKWKLSKNRFWACPIIFVFCWRIEIVNAVEHCLTYFMMFGHIMPRTPCRGNLAWEILPGRSCLDPYGPMGPGLDPRGWGVGGRDPMGPRPYGAWARSARQDLLGKESQVEGKYLASATN